MGNKRSEKQKSIYQTMWEMIPIGNEHPITYTELQYLWGVKTKRQARSILSYFATHDMGDNYVLIRNSDHRGFYRTKDLKDIEAYFKKITATCKNLYSQIERIIAQSAVLMFSENPNEYNVNGISPQYFSLIALKTIDSINLSNQDETLLKS